MNRSTPPKKSGVGRGGRIAQILHQVAPRAMVLGLAFLCAGVLGASAATGTSEWGPMTAAALVAAPPSGGAEAAPPGSSRGNLAVRSAALAQGDDLVDGPAAAVDGPGAANHAPARAGDNRSGPRVPEHEPPRANDGER